MAEAEIKPVPAPHQICLDQLQSPLFSTVPAEIRAQILEYALTDCEDKTRLYDEATCYRRPNYLAPRRTYTDVLRTCQRLYNEFWYLPYSCAEQVLYLTAAGRKPDRSTTVESMQSSLNAIHASHPDVTLSNVHVFAQLYILESGLQLNELFEMNHFRPRSITITIRHTDTWFWERDEPLRIAANWVNACRFPNSLRELHVELESLQRKKDQVDHIAKRAAEEWFFRLRDGTVLESTAANITTMQWSGSSTWEDVRWIRDETRPDTLDYHVATMTWRRGRDQTALLQRVKQDNPSLNAPSSSARDTSHDTGRAGIAVPVLQRAGVEPGMSAEEVWRRVQKLQPSRQWQQQGPSRRGRPPRRNVPPRA